MAITRTHDTLYENRSISSTTHSRQKLEDDVKEFLAKGGKITPVSSQYTEEEKLRIRKRLTEKRKN